MNKIPYSDEQKIAAVDDWLSGRKTAKQLQKELHVTSGMLSQWKKRYQSRRPSNGNGGERHGAEQQEAAAPDERKHGRRYTEDFKRSVIARMANEKVADLAVELNISAQTINNWRRSYGGMPMAHGASAKRGAVLAGDVQDAAVYLRHAKTSVMDRVRAGMLKEPDEAHLLAMLALKLIDPLSK